MIRELRKSFVFRLQPTDEQITQFLTFSHASQFIYNWGLGQIQEIMEQRKKEEDPEKKKLLKIPTKFDFNYKLTDLRKNPDVEWLKNIPLVSLRASIIDLSMGMQHFFRRIKNKETPGFPRFKSRHFDNAFRVLGTKVHNNYVFIAKVGWVKFRKSRDIEGIAKEATVKREGNHWYVAISCIIPVEVPEIIPKTECSITLDFDNNYIKSYILLHTTNSVKRIIDISGFSEKKRENITNLQTRLATKVKDSRSRYDCIEKIKSIHRMIKNRRKNLLHKVSTNIVREFDMIYVQKHPIKDLMKQEAYAKSLAYLGWSNFVDLLKYKCEWFGKTLIFKDKY